MLCLIYVLKYSLPRVLLLLVLFSLSLSLTSNCFYLHILHMIRYTQVGLVWFCTICTLYAKKLAYKFEFHIEWRASKQKRDCATFQLLYIPYVWYWILFSFTLFLFLSFLRVSAECGFHFSSSYTELDISLIQ